MVAAVVAVNWLEKSVTSSLPHPTVGLESVGVWLVLTYISVAVLQYQSYSPPFRIYQPLHLKALRHYCH